MIAGRPCPVSRLLSPQSDNTTRMEEHYYEKPNEYLTLRGDAAAGHLGMGRAHTPATDLLGSGQVKLQTGVEFTTLRPTVVDYGSYTKFENRYTTTVGVGIGHDMQVDFSFAAVMSSQNLEPSGIAGHRGVGSPAVSISYKLPTTCIPHLELLAGIGVVFESDGQLRANAGDSTDISPLLAASYRLVRGYTPYVSYRAHLRAQNWADNSQEVAIGVEKELNAGVSVGCKGTLLFEPWTSVTTASQDASVELHALVALGKNISVVPLVAALQQSRRTVGEYKQQPIAGITSGISLFFYF